LDLGFNKMIGMKAIGRAWACAIVLAVLGCAQQQPPPLPSSASNGAYRLNTGDTVRVLVYNQQSLSNDFTVTDDGTISFPMVGVVKARGETVQELEHDLYNKLNDGVLVKPGVSVQLAQARPIFVVGEVGKPGQYPFVAKLNVLGAVAAAGGFTVRADHNRVTVVRAMQDRPSEWTAGVLADLQPGDVVVVREQFF
jgi:polysaccharide biosynthesis/export protein